MRILIIILLVTISTYAICQNDNSLKGSPKTIEESFLYFDQIFDDTTKYTFMVFPEDIATSIHHFNFGMWIRNNWGLWGDSELKKCLTDSGFVHPDDMSAILFKAYHRHLNDKPLNIKKEAIKYQAYWNQSNPEGFSSSDLNIDHDTLTPVKKMIDFFQPGDTIVIGVHATYRKLFKDYASGLKGIAVIKERKSDKLLIKLIQLEEKKGYIAEKKIGDEYEVLPLFCKLIPPKNWNK